ncbi:Vomp family autotransporter [Bartonella mastomydis]|uniref:Vomp family autotransporter n=1 Tax=Bartonella mastomydis TaxID=1820002 RepID=UPI001FE69A10|nr:Vomp family autotransporter [Bartonella mastomydis]
MKELSIISKRNDWDYRHFSRHLFKKLLLGTIIVAFLSNTSPVYAKNFDRTEQLLQVLEKATAVYSQKNNRNVFSDYNRYNPHTGFFDDISLSKSSYLTVLTTAIMSSVSTSSSYVDFLITMLSEKGKTAVNVLDKDSSSTQKNLESSVDDNHGNGIALLNTPSSSEERYPIQVGGRTFVSARGGSNATNLGQGANAAGQESVAIGHKAQATGKFAITMGDQAQATKEDSIAIGHMAHALGKSSTALGSEYNEKNQDDYTTAKGDYSTALGAVSKALEYGTTAVGHRAYATGKNAISIGFYSRANVEGSVVLGADAKAEKKDSVALGDSSVADTASQIFGFDPLLKKATTDGNAAWKSGRGAVSVGTLDKTRQITKVAAGTQDTDAVNIAQLKSLQAYVDKGWKLSVDGKNAKAVGIDGSIDFATGSNNFNITKGEKDNKVTFDLAKNITLESVKAGQNIFDATGLKIANGLQITTAGINAGSKKITNVVDGTDDTDAVNFSQLKKAVSVSRDNLSEWSKNKVRLGVPDSWTKRGSVVIGAHWEEKRGDGAVVFQGPIANSDFAIAIGTTSYVDSSADEAIAIGYFAKVQPHAKGAIALGSSTVTSVKEGISGYDPKTGQTSTLTEPAWKSGYGALGIGVENRNTRKITSTRQIVGVAAGTNDTDAVNVAQLKSLRGLITRQGSWELSVGDKNTAIGAGDKLNLATGSANFSITSNAEEKKVTFDLAKDLTLNSIKLGGESLENAANSVTLDATGLIITNGPKIMTAGIDAGNKKITNLAEGTEATDAVNFGQLQKIEKEVEQQVVASSFVKQEAETKHITIGKDTEGDKIDIANKNGDKRTLTGIKDAALSAESKEAVTGSQLFSTNNDVTILQKNFSEIQTNVTGVQTNLSAIAKNTSQYLGGGSDVVNGKVPTYTVEGKSYNDVASAFSGVSSFFTEVKQQITNVNNTITNVENQIKNVVSESLVQQDKETQHITIGKDIGGDKIDITNNKNEKRTLTGIKDGALSAESKEAVTGSQLFETNQKVNTVSTNLQTAASNIAKYFGGNAKYEDGKWTDPEFTVKIVKADGNPEETSYSNVAEAFAGVGTSLTNIQNNVTEQVNNVIQKVEGESLVQQDKATQHITIGKDTEGDKIDIANKNKEKRTLTGIKAGVLLEDSNEAVIGSQLFETNNKVSTYLGGGASYKDGKWSAPTFKVQTVDDQGNKKDESYTDVAAAFEGVGTSITNVQNKVTNDITNKFSELNQNITNITQQVTGDALLWDDEAQAFAARHKKKAEEQNKTTGAQENSKITFLLDGAVSKDSTDAITGKQLYSTSNTFATYLDKGAGYDEQGNWKDPSFQIKTVNGEGKEEDKNYTNIAEALTGVGTSFINVQNKMTKEITNQINNAITTIKGESLIKKDESTNNINIGQEVEGSVINIVNKNGEARTLSGVKEAMEVDEAINKGQLDKAVKGLTEDLKFESSFAVHYDKKSTDNEEEADYTNITLGKNNTPTALHNVANGIISDKSHDAITGGQIYKIGGDIAKFLGGDAAFNNGAFTGPTYALSEVSEAGQVTDKSFSDVGKAFAGLDSNIKNVNDRIKEVSQEIAQDSLLWSKQDGAFVASHGAGDTRKDSKITHISAGDITAVSTDAVIGKQLYELHQTLATYLGGGSEYNKDKGWKAPDFKIQQFGENGKSEEKTYHDVAAAFEGVNNSVTNMHDKITNQISQVVRDSLVKQEKATDLITIGKATDGIEINIANKNDEARTLSGVKTATKDNEAVNKSQLDTSIKDANNKITNKFNDFTKNITNITQQVKGDALLWSEADKAFTADHGEGSSKTNSKITHLLDGAISSDSTDAITGRQLYSMGSGVSASLGGGASYEEGRWTTPTFTVNNFDIKGNTTQEDYKTVSDALLGLSNSLTNIHNEMNNQITNIVSDSLVKQDDKTKLITVGGEKDGSEINIANKDKEDRTLSGVKAATQDNEAVNKAQLDKLDKKIESTDSFAVFYDKQSDGTVNYKSVTFGGKNKEPVALHNVADGELTQESHDAMNGGQITKIFQQVVKYFGGSAAFKEGIFTGPIYKLLSISEDGEVGQKAHDNIVSAFEGLDTNIKNVNKRIKEVSQGISDDSLLWDKDNEAFVALHGEGKTRTNSKITYLKAGDVTASSSDAVNGSQLYSLNEQLASYLGGGAGYDQQGNWQAPNFKIKQFGEDGGSEEKSYSNIADALSGVGNSFTNIQHRITHEINKIESENLVKQDEKTKRITIGGEKDGSEISIANSANGVRSLSGVKAGLLTEESTEAINGSQLYSVINVLSRYFSGDAGYKDGKWLAPNFKVAQFTAAGVVSKREEYTNIASAIEAVNESMTNINNRIHDVEQSIFSGGLNWSETEKAFDARHKGQDSKIKHVADGEISEGSKEAVNGRQLWQTNKKVKEVESHVNMIDKQVKDIASVADIAVKYDKGNDGKKTNKVTLIGMSESDPVLIDNVADGRIESDSKEAVTGGQLHDYTNKQMNLVLSDAKRYTDERFKDIVNNTVHNVIHETKSYTDVKFEALRYEIKEVRKESKKAAAVGLAVSNLSYEDTPGSLSLSIGTGTWRNQSAFAVGAGYMSEDGRIRSNISATSSGRHWGIGAGLRVKLN